MQLLKTNVSSQWHPISMALRSGFIHSTAAFQSKKRSNGDNVHNKYVKQHKRAETKRTLLRNVRFFAEHLFQNGCQSWHSGKEQNGHGDSKRNIHKQNFSKGNDKHKTSNNYGSRVPEWLKSYRRKKRKEENSWFSSDEAEEVEIIFEASSGRGRYCFWSFNDLGDVQWRSSAWKSNDRGNSDWRWRINHEKSYSREYDSAAVGSASDRTTLGLAAAGPLNLDDVKNAFRTCALKWHPDRHQGPSKVIAEEKFKHCGAAYKSLCDALATT